MGLTLLQHSPFHKVTNPQPALAPFNCPPAVYTAFYLQQAAVLFSPNGTRSLHVGLGVGTAVKGMQRVGITAGELSGRWPWLIWTCRAAARGCNLVQHAAF